MQAGEPRDQECDVGCRQVGVPEAFKDIKMPVGKGAITDAIEDSQYKPGSCSQQYTDKVCLPGFLPYPAKQVKQDQACVEDSKKYIQETHA